MTEIKNSPAAVFQLPSAELALDPLSPPPRTANEKQTAKLAIKILLELDVGFHLPTNRERDALLVGFAMRRKVLYGAAFDIVRCRESVNLTDSASIAANISSVTTYEIKSTNKAATRPDFGGYFFDLTTAELLVAQSLGDQYRFAFVNTLSRMWVEMTLNQIFQRARKIYPKWAISF
jgi:hypothetical protein